MEDIWFATNNGRRIFNLYDVKVRKKLLRHINKMASQNIGKKLKTVIFVILAHQISGTISQFLTGQCQKIQHTRLKNPKNLSLNSF